MATVAYGGAGKAWHVCCRSSVGEPNKDIFLIGHSLGTPAILRYLETLKDGESIGGAILVAGPIRSDEKYVHEFLIDPFQIEKIKKSVGEIVIIHGDNDGAVPFAQAEELASLLSSKLITIKNGGHLNGESGWYQLPEALDEFLRLTTSK